MAEKKAYTKKTYLNGFGVFWELGGGEEGAPYTFEQPMTVTFQVNGGGIEILGSIIEGEFCCLNDTEGMPMFFSVAGIRSSPDAVKQIMPRMSYQLSQQVRVAMIARK